MTEEEPAVYTLGSLVGPALILGVGLLMLGFCIGLWIGLSS